MCLPNFVICGAQRCGTTSLYHYLAQHPDVFMAARKETHYFSKNLSKGLDWYQEHFADGCGHRIIGEASPTYMDWPQVPTRMARVIPEAKLCFVVRNPVDRAYSAYWFSISFGQDPNQTFSEAIRTQSGHDQYLGRGYYYDHIKRFLEFYDSKQTIFVITEELKSDTAKQVSKCYEFLGVDCGFVPDVRKRFNQSRPVSGGLALYGQRAIRRAKTTLIRKGILSARLRRHMSPLNTAVSSLPPSHRKPPISAQDRAYLGQLYAEHNSALADFLGRDLPW